MSETEVKKDYYATFTQIRKVVHDLFAFGRGIKIDFRNSEVRLNQEVLDEKVKEIMLIIGFKEPEEDE